MEPPLGVQRPRGPDEGGVEISDVVDGDGEQLEAKSMPMVCPQAPPIDSFGRVISVDDDDDEVTVAEDGEGLSGRSSPVWVADLEGPVVSVDVMEGNEVEEDNDMSARRTQVWLTDIEGRLRSAQEVGRAWRRRVRRPMLAVAILLMPGGLVSWEFLEWGSPLMTIAVMLSVVGNMALFLALLPTDRFALKWAGRFYLTMGVLIAGMNAVWFCFLVQGIATDSCITSFGSPVPCIVGTVRTALYGVFIVSLLSVLWWFFRKMGERRQVKVLEITWRGYGMVWTVIGIYWIIAAVIFWPYDHVSGLAKARILTAGVWEVVMAWAGFTPGIRARFQAWLAWHGGSEMATAARIAELLGQRPANEVIESANASFRCVLGDAVTREGMANNSVDVSLRQATVAASLGQVDAFVSHSWHDNADAKWAALQEWRQGFVRHHGVEPKLWIDKCCIDPGNLDEGLRCLPLYVAGCNKLLVLCGETYVRRAWCLLEIFVFVAMGGELEDIEVRFLPPPSGAAAPPAYEVIIDTFDAGMATCTLDDDTSRLQAIFTAGFSDAASLTDVVKEVFKRCHAGFERGALAAHLA